MKITFTLNNMTFESNDNQTYFYAIWNGKKQRIKKHEFEQAQRELAIVEAKAAELDKAAEDENVSVEEFVQRIEDWNDMQDSHNAWTAVDDITYDIVAHAIHTLGKNDEETEEIMGMIGKDAKMVMDFNEATSTLNADEFNAYIKSQLDVLLNGGATGSLTEATEAHSEVKTAENTTDGHNATESLGEATENASKKKTTKRTNKRVSKNIAWGKIIDGVDVSLTEKQVDFIKHLPDTNFWEHGLDSAIWVDILCDEIGGQFAGKPMTVGAMVSTLCEKNLGQRAKDRMNGKKCTSFALTDLGKKVAEELGLH